MSIDLTAQEADLPRSFGDERPVLQSHTWLIAMALVFASLIPLLVVQLPPMVDVLGHAGRYAIQVGLQDQPGLQAYYGFEWKIIGNLGADILIAILAPLFGIETSVRLILILTQLCAATGILLLSIQRHRQITCFAILALPLIYCFPFNYGFINFTLSMALALLAFSLWLRLSALGLIRLRQWLFIPISCAIWLTHTFGWGFLGLLCGAAALVESEDRYRKIGPTLFATVKTCLPLLVALIPMLLWRSQSSGSSTDGWFVLEWKLMWLASPLRLDWQWGDLASVSVIYAAILMAGRSKLMSFDPVLRIAALACLLVFLLLPMRLFGSSFADMRIVPYMLIAALLAIVPDKTGGRSRTVPLVLAAAFLVARLAMTADVYHAREKDLDRQLEALSAIPKGARVATLVSLRCPSEWPLPWLTHVGSMAIVRNHAFANDQWYTPGMNMLTVKLPSAGDYASDPSQMAFADRCKIPDFAISARLAHLPAAAFTHVWIVGVDPAALPHRDDLKPVWVGRDAVVFRTRAAFPDAKDAS